MLEILPAMPSRRQLPTGDDLLISSGLPSSTKQEIKQYSFEGEIASNFHFLSLTAQTSSTAGAGIRRSSGNHNNIFVDDFIGGFPNYSGAFVTMERSVITNPITEDNKLSYYGHGGIAVSSMLPLTFIGGPYHGPSKSTQVNIDLSSIEPGKEFLVLGICRNEKAIITISPTNYTILKNGPYGSMSQYFSVFLISGIRYQEQSQLTIVVGGTTTQYSDFHAFFLYTRD